MLNLGLFFCQYVNIRLSLRGGEGCRDIGDVGRFGRIKKGKLKWGSSTDLLGKITVLKC